MIYDLHTHFYPSEFFERIEEADSDFSFGVDASGMRYISYQNTRFFGITAPMSDIDLRLEAMDSAGVDVAVISVGPLTQFIKNPQQQASLASTLNDRYAKLMTDYPDRIKGYATLPMTDEKLAIAELDRCIGQLRFNGVIVPSNIAGTYFDDDKYRWFLEAADDRGLCVFVHPLIPPGNSPLRQYVLGPIVGFPFDTTVSVARLVYSGLIARYPRIKWHIAHAGGALPWLMERMDCGWTDYHENRTRLEQPPSYYLKQLYYDTVSFSPHTVGLLRDVVGADHMVVGTDFPHPLGSIERGVANIKALNIPEREREEICSKTALSILNNVD